MRNDNNVGRGQPGNIKEKKGLNIKFSTKILIFAFFIFVFYDFVDQIKGFIFNPNTNGQIVVAVDTNVPKPDWSNIDGEFKSIVSEAKRLSTEHAEREIDKLFDVFHNRMENNFLNWYLQWSKKYADFLRSISSDIPLLGKSINSVEEEFYANVEKRIIIPNNARMTVERISKESAGIFQNHIQRESIILRSKYKINDQKWEKYLQRLGYIKFDNSNIPVELKAVIVGGFSLAAKKSIAPTAFQLVNSGQNKLMVNTVVKPTAKKGTAVAIKIFKGGKIILGKGIPVIGWSALIAWEYFDHKNYQKRAKNEFTELFEDWSYELRKYILHHPDDGILSMLNYFEMEIYNNLN